MTSQPQFSRDSSDSLWHEGLIIDGSRGLYRVETAAGIFACTIRGKLRKDLAYSESASAHKRVQQAKVKMHDPVAIGDRVRVLPTGGSSGVIEEIVASAGGAFSRGDPDPKLSAASLTTIAGLDQMIPVFAAREPAPHLRLLDRFLITAEAQGIEALICISKTDQGMEPWLVDRLAVYRAAGYRVLLTSAAQGEGVEELRDILAGRTSALLGPSGVGKSSLLNALEPDLEQRVSAISTNTGKGRHTTTGTRLCPLNGPDGGYLADTAGIRTLALESATLAELDRCFPEFRPFLGQCRLNDCSHLHEPKCAVRDALNIRQIDAERYDSYHRLKTGGTAAAVADWDGVE